jgi:hypothetical protein
MKNKNPLLFLKLGVFSIGIMLTVFSSCGNKDKATNPTGVTPVTSLQSSIVTAVDSIGRQLELFRGKNFKRAVHVGVFTQSEYASMVGSGTDSTSPADQATYNKIMKIEGLLRPNADYFSSYDSTMSTETAGFYVPGTDSLYIILADNAKGLTLDDSITIFHELTHALQDQYFNLIAIDTTSDITTDQYFASKFVVEGEAELMEDYYYCKLSYGSYVTPSQPISSLLASDQIWADQTLDSLHLAGEPMLTNMPFIWEYYSYGPTFMNAIAGTNFGIIDNSIFPSMPSRMLEIFHPGKYNTANEFYFDVSGLESLIGSSNIVWEDELGELMTDVMLREWNIPSFKTVSTGIVTDMNIVFSDPLTDSLRMVWSTGWQDSTTAAAFFTNYITVVNNKRSITLPQPVMQPSTATSGAYQFVNDTVNNIYLEQSGANVFTVENYKKTELQGFITQCRALTPVSMWGLAKRQAGAGAGVKYTRLKKVRNAAANNYFHHRSKRTRMGSYRKMENKLR